MWYRWKICWRRVRRGLTRTIKRIRSIKNTCWNYRGEKLIIGSASWSCQLIWIKKKFNLGWYHWERLWYCRKIYSRCGTRSSSRRRRKIRCLFRRWYWTYRIKLSQSRKTYKLKKELRIGRYYLICYQHRWKIYWWIRQYDKRRKISCSTSIVIRSWMVKSWKKFEIGWIIRKWHWNR